MRKEYLGEFEELILTLVAALQDDAYGAAIAEELETRVKREVNLSAIHVTLYRLEDKGLIKSSLGELPMNAAEGANAFTPSRAPEWLC